MTPEIEAEILAEDVEAEIAYWNPGGSYRIVKLENHTDGVDDEFNHATALEVMPNDLECVRIAATGRESIRPSDLCSSRTSGNRSPIHPLILM